MDASDAELAVEAACEAFKTWQDVTGEERGRLLRKWAKLVKENAEALTQILAGETRKLKNEAKLEEVGLVTSIDPLPGKKLLIEKQPLGVVVVISPWNFPPMLSSKKVATALAAGSTCVVKPPEDAPLSTLSAVQLAQDARIPKRVINVVTCDRSNASQIGKIFCESKLVAGISFTGSTAIGKILHQQCGPHIKRISLELGGTFPFLVSNSANIDEAAQLGIQSKFFNCGQVSIADIIPGEGLAPLINSTQFKRVCGIVEDAISKGANVIVEGQPAEDVGKLFYQPTCGIVEDAISKGANVIVGGQPAEDIGELFYQPTLITEVTAEMQIYTEEIFGPVASVIKFKTEEEGVAMANDTEKGLGSYFFSQDVSQIFRVSRLLQNGVVWVNEGIFLPNKAPFGGVKESGIGREGSHHGIEDFTYIKFICMYWKFVKLMFLIK
ncbi:Aldehyde dehydrogenase family [Popillia japonica]|uniref:Aldehyde dehydrogenase family n=1 Tax=Popillia japonica TaxID=7064 RepID=A0AAW1IVJ9_POPJA